MSNHRPFGPPGALVAVLLAAALLSACGGGDHAASRDGSSATPLTATSAIAPLFDDEGGMMPSDPAAAPADPAAHTRRARYATEAQADQVEAAMGTLSIPVRVAPTQGEVSAVELAVTIVYALQAAHGLQPDAPVFVRGADLRLAAATADRIAEAGYSRVFLVTR